MRRWVFSKLLEDQLNQTHTEHVYSMDEMWLWLPGSSWLSGREREKKSQYNRAGCITEVQRRLYGKTGGSDTVRLKESPASPQGWGMRYHGGSSRGYQGWGSQGSRQRVHAEASRQG